jgi:hypothetical protein
MRNRLIWAALGLIMSVQLPAQKVDLDKRPVFTSLRAFPSQEVDTAYRTYSIRFNGQDILPIWNMDVESAKNTFFKLEGYRLVDEAGDLQLEAKLSSVNIYDLKITSRVEKSKDKAGRETSRTFYRHVLTYQSGFTWKITDKNGRELASNRMDATDNQTAKTYQGSEYGTYREASDAYLNNSTSVNTKIASDLIKSFLQGMYERMNWQVGYRTVSSRFILWVVGSKNHPEYAASQTHYNTVKAAFEAMSINGLQEKDLLALQPAIDYYRNVPNQYKTDEKADAKLRYAAYYNLANIYLFLDQTDKVPEYANLLIQNDYDKNDGKDFIKDVEKLKGVFIEKKAAARRFVRG